MRVSIILPTYNSQKTIAATLQSLVCQTYKDLEIIIVDDGCTDNTMVVVEQYARDDSRIKIIHQANAGVSEARQTGLDQATCEFVATLDADDIWHPTKIEKQVQVLMTRPDVAAVYCWSRRVDDEGRVIFTQPAVRIEGFILCRHVYDNVVGNGSCLMMRRSSAVSVGGFRDLTRDPKKQSADDHLFQLRLAIDHKYAVVPEYLVGYRMQSQSISVNKEKMYLSILKNLQIIRQLSDEVPERVYSWSRAASFFDMIGFHLRQSRPQHALRVALGAFWLDPIMFVYRLGQLMRARVFPLSKVSAVAGVDYFDLAPTDNIVESKGLFASRMKRLSKLDDHIYARRAHKMQR